jgi:PAS domain S-box-containing protein
MNSDAHLTSLFENATEGIVLTNSSGLIILVNPSAQKMFGYREEELIGRPIEILVPTRYKTLHKELRQNFYQDPQNRVMGHGRDLNGRRKDDSDIPLEVSLSFYKQNDELFVIAFIVDITYRKQVENNLELKRKELERMALDMQKLNTQLETKVEERTIILKEALHKLEQSQHELNEALESERQLSEIKSRFVSMASHEFRTPLSTVLSSASLLSKYTTTQEQEKRDKHINRIKDSVKHLNDILEDLLSLGKLSEGKIVTISSKFNLKELILETVDEMRGLLKKDQEFFVHHTGEEIIVSDKKLLRNIFINLITNAIKFSQEAMAIEIESVNTNKNITVSVKDKGVGISDEDQVHLFSSFFRGKNVLNIQGTGLGLHIVKKYLDLLNGFIDLKSELNKGTTITITLPNN